MTEGRKEKKHNCVEDKREVDDERGFFFFINVLSKRIGENIYKWLRKQEVIHINVSEILDSEENLGEVLSKSPAELEGKLREFVPKGCH